MVSGVGAAVAGASAAPVSGAGGAATVDASAAPANVIGWSRLATVSSSGFWVKAPG